MRRLATFALFSLAIGCTDRSQCAAGDLALPPSATFAVLRSDHLSSAITLVDPDGNVITSDLVDSGTRVSSLVTSLAGDAVLPSTPLGSRTVAWLDRLNIDVLTLVTDSGAEEIDTRGEDAATPHTGFSANPYDAYALDDGRILVARYQPNLDASAPELQRGNDVVVVQSGHVTQRIDLAGDETLAPCTGQCTAFARPSVLLPLTAESTHRVLVVLDRITYDFQTVGTGAVVTIDPGTLIASAPFELAGLQNCPHASIDPMNPARAYVLCSGPAFSDDAGRRPTSGIVELTMDATGALSITGTFMPSAADPAPFNGLIALGDRRVLYVSAGKLDPLVPDRLALLDLAAGVATIAYTAGGAFVLGEGFVTRAGALVPDAHTNAILRLAIDGASATVVQSVAMSDCVDLPPIWIRPLDF